MQHIFETSRRNYCVFTNVFSACVDWASEVSAGDRRVSNCTWVAQTDKSNSWPSQFTMINRSLDPMISVSTSFKRDLPVGSCLNFLRKNRVSTIAPSTIKSANTVRTNSPAKCTSAACAVELAMRNKHANQIARLKRGLVMGAMLSHALRNARPDELLRDG
jgi:hypothetical protein